MKLRVLYIILTAIAFSPAAFAQKTFTIQGQLASNKQGIVFLIYSQNGKQITDSATVTNGKFTITGPITEPNYTFITLNPKRSPQNPKSLQLVDVQSIFLEPGIFTIKGDSTIGGAIISGGGKTQQAMNTYAAELKSELDQNRELSKKMAVLKSDHNSKDYQETLSKMKAIDSKVRAYDSIYINNHPNDYFSFFLWKKYNRLVAITSKSEAQFNRFGPDIRNSYEGKGIAVRLDLLKKLAPGNNAPDFTLPDANGKQVSLSSFKGKNVMLVFWFADFMGFDSFSFNIGRINRRLHDKNFAMLSVYYDVSQEGDTEHWLNTINEDAFQNCINLQDIGGLTGDTHSAVAQAYGIASSRFLPLALLIGPDGKIINSQMALNNNELALDIEKQLK